MNVSSLGLTVDYIRTNEYSDRMVNQTFIALSDPTRLRILNLLRGGELCVGDLVHLLAVPQPKASRHLGCLRNAGLVTARREGLWSFYALAKPANEFHRLLLGALEVGLNEPSEFIADTQSAAEFRRVGGCCPQEGPRKQVRRNLTKAQGAVS